MKISPYGMLTSRIVSWSGVSSSDDLADVVKILTYVLAFTCFEKKNL